jgi:hypothetical protein
VTRTVFLVDGFNLFHALLESAGTGESAAAHWLDVSAFCGAQLQLLGPDYDLSSVEYFTALARHQEAAAPGVTLAQARHLECLRACGVLVHLGHFKRSRRQRCPHCGERFTRFVEKETDVAMAVRMLRLIERGECDAVALVTGDADLAPAMREVRDWRPETRLFCFFPWRRHREELARLADASFRLAEDSWRRHLLPDPFRLPDGQLIRGPRSPG